MLSAWLTVTTRPHRLTCSCGPPRNVTGEAMPTSFVEALTQLSFLEFVQRCNLLIAPSQPTQLPASVSLMDVAVQTASPCEVSQDSSTQTSDQPVSSLSLDVAVQTIFHSICSSSLDAAVQTFSHSSLSRDVSTQFGSRPASSFSVGASMQTSTHNVVQLDAATQHDLTEFLVLDFLRQSIGSSTSCLSVPAISAGLTCGTSATART